MRACVHARMCACAHVCMRACCVNRVEPSVFWDDENTNLASNPVGHRHPALFLSGGGLESRRPSLQFSMSAKPLCKQVEIPCPGC